jgi:hypothetical protein
MADRKQTEDRVLHIINYIDQDKMLKPLVGSLKLFSTEELLQLLEFLETWDYKPIHILLDNKIKEYLALMSEIKQKSIQEKMAKVKKQEFEERKKEVFWLNNLLAY